MIHRSYGYDEFSLNYSPLADRINLTRQVGNDAEFRARDTVAGVVCRQAQDFN